MSKKWTEAEIQRQAHREVKKARRTASGRKVDDFIVKMIKTSDKAPKNLKGAYLTARERASGIRATTKEKAKKNKLGAGFWFLVLIIVIPILVVVFLILNKKVEIPGEEKFTDEDFRP
jgi:hypothetical protein